MKPPTANPRDVKHVLRSDELPGALGADDKELGQFIPLHYHGQMLADAKRMAAFEEAITKLVPLGAHVADLGGGTGVQSFFAARRARKVTCIERLPHVARTAERLLAQNGVADKVTVVQADARTYLPEEPVDVVVCEMLHAALLREKQLEVIARFRENHEERFGRRIPLIIPEATVLAAQPIYHPYDFHGYRAAVPLFEAGTAGACALAMGQPEVYAVIDYRGDLPQDFQVSGFVVAERKGIVNALRFITKNVVGIFNEENRTVDWHMHYLAVPLPQPFQVEAGDRISLHFAYDAGASIESLVASIRADRLPPE